MFYTVNQNNITPEILVSLKMNERNSKLYEMHP